MKAMILAAGRGSRMKKLTEDTPKPLIKVNGRHLIEYSLQALNKAGFNEVVINVSYLGDQIQKAIAHGEQYGLNIQYSIEAEPLETGGGIKNALPLLGNQPFLLISSDIITDYPLVNLKQKTIDMAHLVLVKKPDYLKKGDFTLTDNHVSFEKHDLTYASFGVLSPKLFMSETDSYFRLTKVLTPAIQNKHITGEIYNGKWLNVGDESLLKQANNLFT